MKAMAIDLGTVRCGIAVSDGLGMLATPLPALAVGHGRDLAERLAAVIAEHGVDVVLIGHPLNMDGTNSPRSRAAETMAARLAGLTPVPVELFDERWTSVEASRRLHEAGHKARDQRQRIDSAAAAVLLQAWLDARASAGSRRGRARPRSREQASVSSPSTGTGHEIAPAAVVISDLFKDFVPPLRLSRLLTFRWAREHIRAIEGMSLTVPTGTVHALVGPNGAGKTTLIKCVCGLLQPNRGTVRVQGLDTCHHGTGVRREVGYCITDHRSFYWRLSGRENLRFFGTLQGLTGAVREARVEAMIHTLELADVAERQVMSYSEGMKQRLSLARALLHEPSVLLLDEIGRGLDPRLRDKVYTLLRDRLVREHGMTILMASHNLDEVAALADTVHVIQGGRIVGSGSFDAMKKRIDEVFSDHAGQG